MEITYTIEETAVKVALIGDLDTPSTVEIQPKFDVIMEHSSKTVKIDCTDLNYIASSGLRQLIALYKKCKAEGGKLVLANVNSDVMEIFAVTNFDKVFNFE